MRTFAAVFLGYVALAVFVMASVSAAWSILGAELAFEAGTTKVSGVWMALNLALSLVAALLGGWISVAVGKARRPSVILAGVVLILGLIMAAAQTSTGPEGPGDEVLSADEIVALPMTEAASYARQPSWYAWALPFIGACGALVGGRLRTTAAP